MADVECIFMGNLPNRMMLAVAYELKTPFSLVNDLETEDAVFKASFSVRCMIFMNFS